MDVGELSVDVLCLLGLPSSGASVQHKQHRSTTTCCWPLVVRQAMPFPACMLACLHDSGQLTTNIHACAGTCYAGLSQHQLEQRQQLNVTQHTNSTQPVSV